MRSLIVTIALIGVAASDRVHSQSGLDQLPAEIRALLLSGSLLASGEPYEVLLTAPPTLPPEVLPSDAKLEAAVVSKSGITVVARLAGPDLAQVPYLWQLAGAGWVTYSPPFALSMASETLRISMCRGDEFLSVVREPSAKLVRIALSGKPPPMCARATRNSALLDFPAPMMVSLPAGVQFKAGQGGGGADERYHNVRVETTTVSPETIAKFITTQLIAAGWKLESEPTTEHGMSVARLSATCRGGEPATAVLTVTTLAGTAILDVMLRLIRQSS